MISIILFVVYLVGLVSIFVYLWRDCLQINDKIYFVELFAIIFAGLIWPIVMFVVVPWAKIVIYRRK